MIEGIPSITAGFVAFARGVATASPMVTPPIEDRIARTLLPFPISALVPRDDHPRARLSQSALRVLSAGLVDHVALRTAAIDHAIREAVERGARQLVVLGAGLDVRAYRLPFLSSVTVFEVDHPATQRYRQAKMPGVAPMAREVVHVAVDFAIDSLNTRLDEAGHDPTLPTIWVWEGVTMYLPREATQTTLGVIGARSSEGSTLAVTYMIPDFFPDIGPARSIVRFAFRSLGEPVIGAMTTETFTADLDQVGFHISLDQSSADWSKRFGANRWISGFFRAERLIVARRSRD